jgi:hypothetical protein
LFLKVPGIRHTRSTASATPLPPPRHSAAIPRRTLRHPQLDANLTDSVPLLHRTGTNPEVPPTHPGRIAGFSPDDRFVAGVQNAGETTHLWLTSLKMESAADGAERTERDQWPRLDARDA